MVARVLVLLYLERFIAIELQLLKNMTEVG